MDKVSYRHREAAYGGEKITLENRRLRLDVFKRKGGWGWGELYGPEQNGERVYLGILEYLGEIDLVAFAHPMRLEAETCEIIEEAGKKTLRFPVKMQTPEEPCMAFNCISPVEGMVELSLGEDDPGVRYQLRLTGRFRTGFRYLRGPWLRVGAYDGGIERDDAMFPGMEWLIGDEWSSGNDFHGPNNSLRVAPHPHKVHIPMMTVARKGMAVTLEWPPLQNNVTVVSRMRSPQPVFASPNFIDRRPEHILGLMLPTAESGLKENTLYADPPLMLGRNTLMQLEACITVTPGRSLDAVVDWVQRHGMPQPPAPRWARTQALDKIAAALNSNLYEEGKGWTYGAERPRAWIVAKPWGKEWRRHWHMYLRFIEWYAQNGADRRIAGELAQKIEWARKQGTYMDRRPGLKGPGVFEMLRWYSDEELDGLARKIIATQRPNGDFPYDPQQQLVHFAQHAAFADRWKPFGLPGDTVLELCMTPVMLLTMIGDVLNRKEYCEAARKTLDFAMPIERPAGGDWWECPLHAPNLLTAGHAAIAYWLGWKTLGEERYLARVRHFLRAMLPFTYLWQPEEKDLLYETKPLYGTTGWHYMAWTDRCVLWQILLLADFCDQIGFDWAETDPALDWRTYLRGVAVAGMRWLVDHTDPHWMFRSESQDEATRAGAADMALADVHDPVDDMYGGIGLRLEPSWLASLLVKMPENLEARKG